MTEDVTRSYGYAIVAEPISAGDLTTLTWGAGSWRLHRYIDGLVRAGWAAQDLAQGDEAAPINPLDDLDRAEWWRARA